MPQRSNIYSFNLKYIFRKLVSILFWCTKNNTHLWGIGISVVFLLLFKKIQNWFVWLQKFSWSSRNKIRAWSSVWDGAFCKNSQQIYNSNYHFCKSFILGIWICFISVSHCYFIVSLIKWLLTRWKIYSSQKKLLWCQIYVKIWLDTLCLVVFT